MDAWNPDQLRKMQAGGNAKLNDFFRQHGVDKATDIRVKYNNRAAEVYRDKIRAEVEGRPFTAPAPGSIRVDLGGGGGGGGRPVSSGRPAPAGGGGGGDGWGDWGGGGGGGGSPAANGGAASNGRSEYTMSQLQASAAVKDTFFERRMQENSARPEGLPPSQGGKYVGFGSAPAPRAAPGGGAGATDDVGLLLSKGLQTLTVAAGSAGEVLRQGTSQVSSLLVDKQVAETAKQTAAQLQEKGTALASAGWTGLQRLYANVASTVESAAKDSGYKIDLGARQVAAQLQSGGDGGYGGHGGGGGGGGMQHSASAGRLDQQQQQQHHHQQQQQSWQQSPQRGGGSGFAGFDDGAGGGGGGWDEWGSNGNGAGAGAGAGGRQQGTARPGGLAPQKSISSPDMRSKAAAEDDWGKW
jgi:ADP-ribosylation factor GTPase-activating protein 1